MVLPFLKKGVEFLAEMASLYPRGEPAKFVSKMEQKRSKPQKLEYFSWGRNAKVPYGRAISAQKAKTASFQKWLYGRAFSGHGVPSQKAKAASFPTWLCNKANSKHISPHKAGTLPRHEVWSLDSWQTKLATFAKCFASTMLYSSSKQQAKEACNWLRDSNKWTNDSWYGKFVMQVNKCADSRGAGRPILSEVEEQMDMVAAEYIKPPGAQLNKTWSPFRLQPT